MHKKGAIFGNQWQVLLSNADSPAETDSKNAVLYFWKRD